MLGESCYLAEDPLRPYQKPKPVCALDYPCLVKDCGIGSYCQQEQVGNSPPKAICIPKLDLCSDYYCPDDMECYVEESDCAESPCIPQPRCSSTNPCILTKCKAGFECTVLKGTGQAPRGKCTPVVRSCTDIECAPGEKCYLTDAYCTKQPCTSLAVCASTNPCANIDCGPGFTCINEKFGTNPPEYRCVLKDDPCKNKRCSVGQKCYVDSVRCIRAPCPPVTGYCADSDPCSKYNCGDGYDCINDGTGYGAPKAVCVNQEDPCYGYSCPYYTTCAFNVTRCRRGKNCPPPQLPSCILDYPCTSTNICTVDKMCIPQYNSGGESFPECVPRTDSCKNVGCPQGTKCTTFTRYPTLAVCARSSTATGPINV